MTASQSLSSARIVIRAPAVLARQAVAYGVLDQGLEAEYGHAHREHLGGDPQQYRSRSPKRARSSTR